MFLDCSPRFKLGSYQVAYPPLVCLDYWEDYALRCVETRGELSQLSPNERKLILSLFKSITGRWTFHSARIHALAWTPDGNHIASASLDTHVYIWSVQKPLKNIALKNVGPGGVSAVEWVAADKVATAGADGCVRVFSIKFHA